MSKIDVYGSPLSHEEIQSIRLEIRENEPAMLVAKYCPIPLVDMIGALGTAAVDRAMNGDREEPWRYVDGALERDWSASVFAEKFVDSVRALGRPLLQGEVAALNDHMQKEATARRVIEGIVDATSDVLRDAVKRFSAAR